MTAARCDTYNNCMNTVTTFRRNFRIPLLRGFSLVELLVVIGVICLLAAILVPSLIRARDLARRAVCCSNVREITKGCIAYANDATWHRGSTSFALPSLRTDSWTWNNITTGNPGGLWLLLSGTYPKASTPLSLSWSFTTSWVNYKSLSCPGATGNNRGVNALSRTSTTFVINSVHYGYLSQVKNGDANSPYPNATPITEVKNVGMVIVADKNPNFTYNIATSSFSWKPSIRKYPSGNSENHNGDGQNVGRLDGSSQWVTTSTLGTYVLNGTVTVNDFYRSSVGDSDANSQSGTRSCLDDSFIVP